MRIGVLIAAVCLCLQGQEPANKDTQTEAKGLPPRATPADYLSQVKVGDVTLAAEFKGHAIPSPQGPLTSEEFVAVEVAFFGAPDARIQLAADNFSLRINGKKAPLPSQPYGLVIASVKDPEYEQPTPTGSKSKTSFGGGGKSEGGDSGDKPAPPPIPIGVQRAMAQRVQKATLSEGDRPLPQAGLVYFQHRGKTQNIKSLELLYEGPAGKATLALQP